MTLVGTTIGRIRVVAPLGKGGMGEVWVGYDETLKRKVALKAIRGDRRLDAETKARFLREARILSQLDHPGICQIHDLIEGDDDSDFLVLELIEGKTLKEALEEDELDGPFRLHVAERVTQALVAAHAKGVAHRDLKPENVMLSPDGGVKVLDFGLAYNVDERLRTALSGEGPASDAAAEESETGATAVPDPMPGTADPLPADAAAPSVPGDNDPSDDDQDSATSNVSAQARALSQMETAMMAAEAPTEFELGSNYPNPFNPETVIPFAVPEQAHVRIVVYDLLGREVAVLLDAVKSVGRYEVRWQAGRFSTGVYIVRMQAGSTVKTRRVTLLK